MCLQECVVNQRGGCSIRTASSSPLYSSGSVCVQTDTVNCPGLSFKSPPEGVADVHEGRVYVLTSVLCFVGCDCLLPH